MSTESAFRPTTYCTILQTSPEDLVDEFGDPMDNETAAATGVPLSILIQSSRQSLPSENRMTLVETITARLRPTGPVNETSRMKDEPTGQSYMTEGLVAPQEPFGAPSVRRSVRRVR